MNLSLKDAASSTIVLTVLFLLAGFGLHGDWLVASIVLGLGLVWLAGQRRGWGWLVSLGLVIFVGLAALGLYSGVVSLWILLATLGALSAWDLAYFARRLEQTPNVDGAAAMKQTHFRRLQIVVGVGLLLGLAALSWQPQLTFSQAVLLGLLMVLSLSWVVGFIRRA
jgi:hypothetical protein